MAERGPEPTVPRGESVESLRNKYAELSRKYAALVERMQGRTTHHVAIERLGRWSLRASEDGFALIRAGRIELGNPRWTQLSRVWVRPVAQAKAGRTTLRTLALRLAGELVASAATQIEARLVELATEHVYVLRLERGAGEAGQFANEDSVLARVTDVSGAARVERELTQVRYELIDRERLRVLGELAAAVAHDLGSTLRSLRFQLATVEAGSAAQEQHGPALRTLAMGLDQCFDTVVRLHDFARSGTLQIGRVQLSQVVAAAVRLFELDSLRFAQRVTVKVDVPALPLVAGAPSELSFVLLNLLRNARDAMPAGGTVRVRGKATKVDVSLSIEDDGPGLSREQLEHPFRPFFTTKGMRGTGLGLWIAHATLERLGARIEAANHAAGGAVFTLRFPHVEAVSSRLPARRRAAAGGAGATAPRARDAPGAPPRRPARRTARRT